MKYFVKKIVRYDNLWRVFDYFLNNILSLLFLWFIYSLSMRPLLLANRFIVGNDFKILNSTNESLNYCNPLGNDYTFDPHNEAIDLGRIFVNNITGGKYLNPHCKTRENVAIVIPYRNRSEHLRKYLDYMHKFLIKQNRINYQIFVVEQNDNESFNRGILMNVGYKLALEDNPNLTCFIFHDVDSVPIDLKQSYTCAEKPKHLCSYLNTMRYVLIYKYFFGVAFTIQTQQYRILNGFSNRFFGWGGEDDDFLMRLQKKLAYFYRYDPTVGRCRMMKHVHNYDQADNVPELLSTSQKRMLEDGLNDLDRFHTFQRKETHRLFTKFVVETHKNFT